MEKRYQVFVSSTYADLKEERQRVIEALMEMDCIPAGMELFPAADQDQMEFIQRVIDDCDYYLLIIGGRYGSTSESGLSYTEQEYEYAIDRGLKVIALLHEDPNSISLAKSELDPNMRSRLQTFRDRVATGRLVKFWKSANELPGLVALSVGKTIKMFPAVGWVRGNTASNPELLLQLNEVRKRNSELESIVANHQPQADVTDLAGLDESFTFHGQHFIGGSKYVWEVSATWGEVFGFIAPYLVKQPNDSTVQDVLAQALQKKSGHGIGSTNSIDDQDFQTVSVQLRALGLVKVALLKTMAGGVGTFWSATPKGEKMMLELRAVRSTKERD